MPDKKQAARQVIPPTDPRFADDPNFRADPSFTNWHRPQRDAVEAFLRKICSALRAKPRGVDLLERVLTSCHLKLAFAEDLADWQRQLTEFAKHVADACCDAQHPVLVDPEAEKFRSVPGHAQSLSFANWFNPIGSGCIPWHDDPQQAKAMYRQQQIAVMRHLERKLRWQGRGLRRIGAVHAFEDLLQHVLMACYRRFQFDWSGPWDPMLSGFVRETARNWVMGLSKRAGRDRIERPAPQALDVAHPAMNREMIARVEQALRRMPERPARTVHVLFWRGFDWKEIAVILCAKEGTVRDTWMRDGGPLFKDAWIGLFGPDSWPEYLTWVGHTEDNYRGRAKKTQD